ncbi:MAG: hypothetical protein GF411_09630 [Candidatus Lokiarchaeota archaeon]|nr:hypothetical protein [Candidatus Lokiarchaeota archaeon]
MDVTFDKDTEAKLKELAAEANLSAEGLIEVVMHQFANNTGSRVYTGRWSSGEVDGVKGFRYVVQWPFKPGFIEAPGDMVKKWRLE